MLYPPLSGSLTNVQPLCMWPTRKREMESTMLLTLIGETVPFMFQVYELHKYHFATTYDDDAN